MEYCQQLQTYKPGMRLPASMTWSEKEEGMRALWDGGISRHRRAGDVPWCKDRHTADICTGLFSRYGNIIHAPDWWIDGDYEGGRALPLVPLDGELYAGRGRFQFVMSVCKRRVPDERWKEVWFSPTDLLPLAVWAGVSERDAGGISFYPHQATRASNALIAADMGITLVEQHTLDEEPEAALEEIVSNGGEGIVFSDQKAYWELKRSWTILKWKPWDTETGVVIDYSTGKHGTTGSLTIKWGTVVFSINCKGDAMRLSPPPVGSSVTFRYRGVTDAGVPKEARLCA